MANQRLEDHISLSVNGIERNFAVQITQEKSEERDYGFVITFDDITELVAAQRNGAWADIARRIAHEIKNPLTPIQLSAERLRRKYNDVIVEDREIFEKCTDTIIRQVGDIGRMVDEFSSFAQLPKPNMENNDVRNVVREAVFLFQVSQPNIHFTVNVPGEEVIGWIDRRLINQAVTNLVKNASEAITARSEQPNMKSYKGQIDVNVKTNKKNIIIEVIDNGCGLPKKNRNRLKEPYMTTREKGTGLGLAIVQRITEQHQAHLVLEDAPHCTEGISGAKISLHLPAKSYQIDNKSPLTLQHEMTQEKI